MKKSLLTLFAALVSLSVLAADMPRQGFGIQVGFAQPILRLNSSSNPQAPTVSGGDFNKETFGLGNKTRLNGIKVGVVYDASYVKGFGSSIGINYTYASGTPGWEACTYDLYNVKEKRTWYKYHELELFADWQYKFEVAKETYIILYTGPSIQYAFALKSHMDGKLPDMNTGGYTISSIPGTEYSHLGSNENDLPDENLKAFNVTWGVGVGFQYKRYFLRGGYDFGLINPYKNRQFDKPRADGTFISTHGRLDQWQIKIGVYLWYDDND